MHGSLSLAQLTRACLGSISFDLKVLNFSVGGAVTFSNTTIFMQGSFAMLLLGMLLAYCLIARRASRKQQLERVKAFGDNLLKLTVLIAYLMYAALCQRLLQLYQ